MSGVDKGTIEQYLKSAFKEEFNPKKFAEEGMASIIPGLVDYEADEENGELSIRGSLLPRYIVINGNKKELKPMVVFLIKTDLWYLGFKYKKDCHGFSVMIPSLKFSEERTKRIVEAMLLQEGIKYIPLVEGLSGMNINAISLSTGIELKFINTL